MEFEKDEIYLTIISQIAIASILILMGSGVIPIPLSLSARFDEGFAKSVLLFSSFFAAEFIFVLLLIFYNAHKMVGDIE